MHLTTIALACALTAQAQTPAEPRQTRAAQTDQTVSVSRGARLAIDNYAGEVVIRVWDKDAVRVQARHNARTKVDIHADANTVTVGTATPVKSNGSIDYDITVPAWMPLKIEGHYDFVTVEGVQSEIVSIYDLELPEGWLPQNQDGEVSEFRLLTFSEVEREALTFEAALVAQHYLKRRRAKAP